MIQDLIIGAVVALALYGLIRLVMGNGIADPARTF